MSEPRPGVRLGTVTPLPIAIQSLQSALTEALAGRGHGRVTLDLGVVLEGGPLGTPRPEWRLHTAQDAVPAVHRIHIDFEVGAPDSSVTAAGYSRPLHALATETKPSAGQPPRSELVIDADDLLETCRQVFGSPGFDNAARAEVFCEAAAGLPLEDLIRVLDHCHSGTRPLMEDPIINAHGRIHRVLQSAPIGGIEAASRLRGCLSTVPFETLLATLQDHWRFGTHWG